MQPLEWCENRLQVITLDPNSVIAHANQPVFAPVLGAHTNYRPDPRSSILDRVADQVLKDLSQLRFISADLWKRLVPDLRPGFQNALAEIFKHRRQQRI